MESASSITGDRATGVSLNGTPLIIGRGVVVMYALLCLITDITLVPSLYNLLHNSPELHAGLAQLGMSPDVYALLYSVIQILYMLIFAATALLLFTRRSNDLMAIFVAVFLLAFGAQQLMASPLTSASDTIPLPDFAKMTYYATITTGWIAFYPFFGLFPDGRFIPRWTIIGSICTLLFAITWALPSDSGLHPLRWWPPIFMVVVFLDFGSALYAQIYRYRKVSTPVQRQQTKWFVYGFALTVIANVGRYALLYSVPAFQGFGAPGILFSIFSMFVALTFTFIPLSIGIAILRYRLWDIDFLINRSLIYGGVTALLAIVFGAILYGVSLLTQGQQSVVGVVIAAIACGALFQPTRRLLQRFVDSRLYGIRIDYVRNLPTSKPAISIPTSPTGIIKDTHIGMYKDLELIGRGGMAEVYKAHHPTLNRTVAIKILPQSLASDPDFRKRFVREAETISRLEHPNIVRLYDYGDEAGMHYMVMEHITGQDLHSYLKSNRQMPLERARHVINDVASALDYAHQSGLVHRDIKPSNIMLEDNRAVLMDFGIAKILDARTAVTKTGVLGTLDYIAPEQIRDSADVDGRADIYALGVMVYQLLTGDLPFKHGNVGALLIAHMTQPPPDIRAVIPDLSRNVSDAISRAMAKEPAMRFSTAGSFAAALA